MNLKTKKIAAREFLILFSSSVLVLLFWGGLEFQNYINLSEINSLNLKIDSLRKEERKFSEMSQEKYDNRSRLVRILTKHYPSNDINSQVWQRLMELDNHDSLSIFLNARSEKVRASLYNEGFNSLEVIQKYIKENTYDRGYNENWKQHVKRKEMRKLLEETKNGKSKKVLSQGKKIEIIFLSVVVLLTVFFLLRYLFYALSWSIKVYRQ